MASTAPDTSADPPLADPESAVELRGQPPRVMRLSRKAIGLASACGFALVGGALIYALQPQGRSDADELYNTDGVAVADNLAGAPKDYGQVPKLGPALPGDLGKPILDAQRRGDGRHKNGHTRAAPRWPGLGRWCYSLAGSKPVSL